MKLVILVSACLAFAGGIVAAQGSWLDRPLVNWNDPGAPMPAPLAADETIAALAKRCGLAVRRGTAAERALADAEWLPFLHVDRQIVERDVEIVGGMTQADGMCRPMSFNVFVFVGGRLAGTLSPVAMKSRADGEIGAVRLAADDTITADFARYTNADALCCPSDRVAVRYRMDRSGPQATVVPVSAQSRRK